MGRLRRLLSDQLFRNSMALMLTTGVTSVFGLLFWTVAAHRYTTVSVGRATAIIAAANVIATLAQLNLSSVLLRFLPVAAEKSRRLAIYSYLATVALSAVLITGFLLTRLGNTYLQGSTRFEIVLALIAAISMLLALQDAILVSLRRPQVALVENLAITIIRLVVVAVAANRLPAIGIAVAWLVPGLMSVPVISVYLFKRVIPRHERSSTQPDQLPPRRRLLSFVYAEYLKSIVSTGTSLGLPLIVTVVIGLKATAFFSLPWLINTALATLLYNVSTSFVVEASFEGGRSSHILRRAIALGLTIIILGTVFETLGGPLILRIFGSNYAHRGTTLLRLLGISLPFSASTSLYSTFTWMDQRVWRLVLLETIYSAILIGLSPWLLNRYGVSGVGVAYLVAQTVFGLGSILPVVRHFRGERDAARAAPHAVPESGLAR